MPKGYALYKAQDGTGTDDATRAKLFLNRELGVPASNLVSQQTAPESTDPFAGVCDPSSPDYDPFTCSILNQIAGGGLGSGSAQAVIPPVLDVLAEMRMRRQAEAQQATNIADILSSNVPRGMTYYPGTEPGGVADVLLGIITGKGPSYAQQVFPIGQRVVRRTGIPVPAGQPPVGADVGEASTIAQSIINALKTVGG